MSAASRNGLRDKLREKFFKSTPIGLKRAAEVIDQMEAAELIKHVGLDRKHPETVQWVVCEGAEARAKGHVTTVNMDEDDAPF